MIISERRKVVYLCGILDLMSFWQENCFCLYGILDLIRFWPDRRAASVFVRSRVWWASLLFWSGFFSMVCPLLIEEVLLSFKDLGFDGLLEVGELLLFWGDFLCVVLFDVTLLLLDFLGGICELGVFLVLFLFLIYNSSSELELSLEVEYDSRSSLSFLFTLALLPS